MVKERKIKVQRLMNPNQTKSIFFDVKVPKEKINAIAVEFFNGHPKKEILIDNLKIEGFNEQ